VSIKDENRASPKDRDSEKSAPNQLQKQIDALVRGEVPQGSRSLRDLAKKPIPAEENEAKKKSD
jgi:hypothetical protein